MARAKGGTADAQERRVWELLVQNCEWEAPPGQPVTICDKSGEVLGAARVQVFELVVTAILASMRPEFVWCVTPNRPDDGLDFIGVQRFLDDRELGIDAAITVGGQCKKRTTVNEVVGEIAGSILRMADAVNPTLIVVALSARLTRNRVERARAILQRQSLRQCHILDRTQIEGLMVEQHDVVTEILGQVLSESEHAEVVAYLAKRAVVALPPIVSVTPPARVRAGVPFRIQVDVQWALASHPHARLWWRSRADQADAETVTLIGPLGAEGSGGVSLIPETASRTPFSATRTLELSTYTVGQVALGELVVGLSGSEATCVVDLGVVGVVENMRPRFFDRPYTEGLARLTESYDRATTGATCSVGVIGAGGSGKSRLCDEFALEKRRRGCSVVSVKHPKTHEEPLRVLADLLVGLAGDDMATDEPAEGVLRAVAQYDGALAERVASDIRSLFGTRTTNAVETAEQHVGSTILLLIVAATRDAPLIVHLQDLHWCGADVLSLLERLVRQLTALEASPSRSPARVLFLFEGRTRETTDSGNDAWTSAPFEAFLGRDVSTVTCSSFTPEDGLSFVRRLFEDRHNSHRLLADDLVTLQDELVDRICRSAGGNPFHTLEQVRLLRERGVVGQNPKTGLMFMIRPDSAGTRLPESVFAAIKLRWEYLRNRAPDLALLVWGSSLLDDRLPAPLFRALWSGLAPNASVRDIDATDMLWTGDGSGHEVAFRHENYFESIRRFNVPDSDRRRVVEAYSGWFASLRRPSASERFGWARALLATPDPDHNRVKSLLVSALRSSRRSGDPRLTRRILAFYLDFVWEIDVRPPMRLPTFLQHCDEERDLCRDLLSLDRAQAAERIGRLHARVTDRVAAGGSDRHGESHDGLVRRLLAADALHSQLLFNDRRPKESADIARRVLDGVRAYRQLSSDDDDWMLLEMETLYTLSCGQAISGEFGPAVRSSADAAEIAIRSGSPLARKVLSTYGTMLLSEDPKRGEEVLRGCLDTWPDDHSSDACLVHVHLAMALALQAYQLPSDSEARTLLDEAATRMTRIHDVSRRLGLYPDAGAAALVRGVVSALSGEDDEARWFAQGVAAAARGRQMETLWRSHINLASALYRKERRITPAARDHALAAVEIMENTLTAYSEPERSPRFEMLRVGMAAAVWLLLAARDDRGRTLLERYPTLRSAFSDPEVGVLAPYDGGPRHYQWLRVDDVDYVLY